MKLLSFEKNGAATIGAHVAEGVVDLTACLRTTHPNIQTAHSMLQIIQSGLDIDRFGEESLNELRGSGRLARFVAEKPKYLPPVTNPPKILALALNFQEHIDETNLKFYEEPIVFAKYPSNMIGHEAEIELPPFPQKVDEEHELGLIVGRDCRHIRPSQAPDYVFGWTICNDVSARQAPARARPDGPALRLCQEPRDLRADGPVDRDQEGAARSAQPQDGCAHQRQGHAQRQYRRR